MTAAWATRCRASRDFPEQAYRSLRGVVRMVEQHSPARIEEACTAALAAERFTAGFVKDQLNAPSPASGDTTGGGSARARTYPRQQLLPERRGGRIMSLSNPIVEILYSLKLAGMAQAYQEHAATPDFAELGFDDRLVMLLERERQQRNGPQLSRPAAQGATARTGRYLRYRLQCRARHHPGRRC